MIKLVAFDWNGTLFSDTKAILDAVTQVLKLFNLKPVSLKTFQKHFDVPVNKAYIKLGVPEDELNKKSFQVSETFHAYYEPRASKVRTRAGANELLKWLFEKNIKSVIFSNHINEPIKKQLKRLKIEKYFSGILANSEIHTTLKGRSKKEKLKNFIENNKVDPNEIIIVGDTLEEIEIGKELGLFTAAITHGNCSTARLKSAKPDYVIKNLKEVIDIIKKLNY